MHQSPHTNDLGQVLGFPVPNWRGATVPPPEPMRGRFCRLEPLEPEVHARDLWGALALDERGESWTYLYHGPFADFESYHDWLKMSQKRPDAVPYAIVSLSTSQAVSITMFLRIEPEAGSIEVGNLHFSPLLQRTPAATEAMFLMMKRAFELGYRRYEWRCNSLNEPSRRAAQRLGFTFEGVFRQAAVVKGHNRDTAWFSILDSEWPRLQIAFETWLAPENFDAQGQQKCTLEACRAMV